MIYENHFALNQRPFSIAPNPQFLFARDQYQEALAALEFGMLHRGGFVLLTGEVGTGKTTLCKHLLNNVPQNTELALVLHPQLDRLSLLQLICREFDVSCNGDETEFDLIERLTEFLLGVYAKGGYSVLVVDEAQHLERDVLELVRLLTNLETDEDKLLQIILLGQPELQQRLNQYDLRQLNQRFTARFHLKALSAKQTSGYVQHRMKVAGGQKVFSSLSLLALQKLSGGIPRLINVIADRCLMGAYAHNRQTVGVWTVIQAAKEVLPKKQNKWLGVMPVVASILILFFAFYGANNGLVSGLTSFVKSGQVSDFQYECLRQESCWQGLLPSQLLEASGGDSFYRQGDNWLALSSLDSSFFADSMNGNNLLHVRTQWDLPFSHATLVKPFGKGESVSWARSVLSSYVVAVDESDWSNWQMIKPKQAVSLEFYDSGLQQKIRAFQSQFSLTVDGVLGQQTLMALSMYQSVQPQSLQAQGGL